MSAVDTTTHSTIVILDFGSQYTQVIARRIRESRVYSEIVPFNLSADRIQKLHPKGIVLSGGPASVFAPGAPLSDPAIFSLGIPVLGICYGVHLMALQLNGEVEFSDRREFGPGTLKITSPSPLFDGLPLEFAVWNSHGDKVISLPPGFHIVGTSENSPFAAIEDRKRNIFGVQFHPEVAHTPLGREILENFLYNICECRPDWTMGSFIERSCREIRERVGLDKVVLGLSGGVDSSVTAALIHRAIGDQLTCIFVNNGLLRFREAETVQKVFVSSFNMSMRVTGSLNA